MASLLRMITHCDPWVGKALAWFFHNNSYGDCCEYIMDTSETTNNVGEAIAQFRLVVDYCKHHGLIIRSKKQFDDRLDSSAYDLTFRGMWIIFSVHPGAIDDYRRFIALSS